MRKEEVQTSRFRTVTSSLRERNYRLYFIGQLSSIAGSWLQNVALAFLVLRLTHSGAELGLTSGALFLPIFVFGPLGGVVADRVDKRKFLFVTQSLLAVWAGAFGLLTATGVIRMWMVFVLALCTGVTNAFDLPPRQSLLAETVPRDKVQNAISLNSVSVNIARVFGAALGGIIVTLFGLALCFGLNALSFCSVLLTLFLMRTRDLYPSPRPDSERHQVRAGLHYVRETPELIVPLMMIVVTGTLAYEFPVSLPLLAVDTFHKGAGTYALLACALALGAIAGGVVSASRSKLSARTLAITAIGWGLAILAAAGAPNLPTELTALVLVGFGTIAFSTSAKSTVQLASAPTMRGRVMALWAVAWQGTTVIGGPIVGWTAQEVGARWALAIGGLPTVLIGVVAWPALQRIDRESGEAKARLSARGN
jgi:MFS family permease